MLRIKVALLFALLASTNYLLANDRDSVDVKVLAMELSALGRQLHSDTAVLKRTELAEQIESILLDVLKDPVVASSNLQLEGISVVQPEDKSFRIFTWQLYVDKNEYKYFGVIQAPNGKIYKLTDESESMRQPEFGKNKPDYWYGALYYGIKAFDTNGEKQYVLLGYDAYRFFERRKIIEILYFDAKGEPRFGSNVLHVQDGYKRPVTVSRYLLQYSAAVSVSLKYDEKEGIIIFDHLVQGSAVPGSGPTSVPDGSYCGLKLEKGHWTYIDKVHQDDPRNVLVNDVNPLEIMNRKTEKRDQGNDIFGKKKKGKP